jgi:ACS family hexuronate transporter-like MFS transporter
MALPNIRDTAPAPAPVARVGHFRWTICGLLFLAATINYVDRQVIGILKPTLQAQFGWSEIDYADIVFAFQLAYAIGFLFADRSSTASASSAASRWRSSVWSLAAMAAAEVTRFGPAAAAFLGAFGLAYSSSVAGFIFVRFMLGLGESGNFPAAIKTVAEWFPRSERAFATGVFNAGTNIGAVITPLTVPFITVQFGWYWAFILTGALGFLWLVVWLLVYERPDRHPPARRRGARVYFERSDGRVHGAGAVAAAAALRQTWAFAAAKFLTDPIGDCTCFGCRTSSAEPTACRCFSLVRRSSSST